ncbi:MAG: hypothetical protein LBH95_03415 [Oscillospiraceae bacterium]|jgi:hypothetical protein|nr:hypothetical protein [Oscillospiraceae bacterium]
MPFAKAVSVLALFMAGEMGSIPFAPFLALPFTALIKPLTANRVAERVLAVLFIPCAAVTGIFTVIRFAELTGFMSLPKTPVWLIAGVTAAVALFLAAGGPEGLGRWAAFTLPFVIGFVALAALLLTGKLQYGGFCIPRVWEQNPIIYTCEAITLLEIMPALRYKEKPFLAFLAALAVSCGLGAAVWVIGNLTLGAELFKASRYPFYTALRVAKGGEVIGRIEALLLPVSLCVTVMKAALCTAVIVSGVKAYRPRSSTTASNVRFPEPSVPET